MSTWFDVEPTASDGRSENGGTSSLRRRLNDDSGSAAVEFGLLAPPLFLILVGMFVFGLTLQNYISVTAAAEAGAFQLTISRGDSTPWTDTRTAVFAAAPSLKQSNTTISLMVNGITCTSDASCSTALTSAAGQTASVSVSYPCNLVVMGVNYLTGCTLSAAPKGRIQ